MARPSLLLLLLLLLLLVVLVLRRLSLLLLAQAPTRSRPRCGTRCAPRLRSRPPPGCWC